MRRVDGVITTVFAIVLAMAAVTWVIVTQTRSNFNAAPTQTATHGAANSAFFSVEPRVIPAGGCVKLSWSFPDATQLVLRGSNWPEGASETVENPGTATACPSAALHYVPDKPVDFMLTITDTDGDERTETITISYDNAMTITPEFPDLSETLAVVSAGMPLPTETPTGTPPTPDPLVLTETALNYFLFIYQPFEHGFMLQRIGEACVFAYRTDGEDAGIILPPLADPEQATLYGYNYCIPFDGLTSQAVEAPADMLLEANTPFRMVWGEYALVRDGLGDPTEEKAMFESALLPTPQVINGGVFFAPIVYLPDGRLFSCGTRAATSGECQIS